MALSQYQHTGDAPATSLPGGIGASDATITVANGSGYPTGAGGQLFVIVIDPGTPSEEKILCSSRASNTFAVSVSPAGRGYDGTAAQAHVSGAVVNHVWTADEANDTSSHIYDTTRNDHTQYAELAGATFVGALEAGSGLSVIGPMSVNGNITGISGTVTMNQTLSVAGAVTLSGAVTVGSTLQVASTLNALGSVNVSGGLAATSAVTSTTQMSAPAVRATLSGTNGRFVGATNGSPTGGPYIFGDFAVDPSSHLFWICTIAGSPGTWISH